jgi:hypothetical protein
MYCFQFAVFLLVILVIQIAIGIVIFVKRDGEAWERAVNESLTDIFNRYNETRTQVDDLQRNVSQCWILKKYGPIFVSTNKGSSVQMLA